MESLSDIKADTRLSSDWTQREDSSVDANMSLGMIAFRRLVRNLFISPATQLPNARENVVNQICRARDPYKHITELLNTCRDYESGLDMAIDVLAKTSDLILRYTESRLIDDISEWTPNSGTAYRPDVDVWYVLLRAVARCDDSSVSRLQLIRMPKNASDRRIVEAVIDALGDLGGHDAMSLLRELSDTHEDDFIREYAAEILDDLEQ